MVDSLLTEAIAILIPIKGAAAEKNEPDNKKPIIDNDVMKEAQEAIKKSLENLKRNPEVIDEAIRLARKAYNSPALQDAQNDVQKILPKNNINQGYWNGQGISQEELLKSLQKARANPAYAEGLKYAEKGKREIQEVRNYVANNQELRDTIEGHYKTIDESEQRVLYVLRIEEEIHNAAVELARQNITYDQMKCNQAVAHVYRNAGLPFVTVTVIEFPGANSESFRLLYINSENDLRTGDIAIWNKGELSDQHRVHHMLIYDKNAGPNEWSENNNAWSTHSSGHKRFFSATNLDIFSNSFGFVPKWYRFIGEKLFN